MVILTISIIALVTGIIFGVIFQRSQLDMSLAFNEAFTFKSPKRLMGIIVAVLTATILFSFVIYAGAVRNLNLLIGIGIDPIMVYTAHAPSLTPVIIFVGGIIFGFGMLLAGGGLAGTLFRIGEGYLASILTFLGIGAGVGLMLLLAAIQGAPMERLPGETIPEMLAIDPILIVLVFSALYLALIFLIKKFGTR